MPVNFKGSSEYNRNFHWVPSRKSASYQPTPQESNPPAGQPSSKLAIQADPPLQTKKRSATSISKSSENLATEEYALLGKHEKFANNIRYRSRSREPPLAKTYKVPASRENEQISERVNGSPHEHRYSSHVRPRKPRGRSPGKHTKSSAGTHKPHVAQQKHGAGDGEEQVVTPLAPREEKEAHISLAKEKRDSLQQPTQSSSPPKRSKSAAVQAQSSDKRAAESAVVQSSDKHAAESAPRQKPQASRSLEYKAGVGVPKHSKSRLSEYQLQFKWQKPVKSSPLLDAEQIIYSTNGPLPPFKSDPVPKFTEYRSQFKPYEYKETSVAPEKNSKTVKEEKIKRSKSEGALHKKIQEENIKSDEGKKKIILARDPQQPKFPHGKHRRYKTEYAVNFKAPMNYEYVDGAWKGAQPAHVIADQDTKEAALDTPSTWFLEVMELRKKALEYKLRARGTHFSKEHLAQLYAKQADCWDAASTVSATLSALALDKPRARPSTEKKSVSSETPRSVSLVSDGAGSVTPRAAAAAAAEEEEHEEEVATEHVQRKLAWTEEDSEAAREAGSLVPSTARSSITARSTSTVKTQDSVGRIPTPKISASNESKRRHHLDLTTPAVNGALLTSPPQAPPSSRSGSVVTPAPKEKLPVSQTFVQSSSSDMRTPPRQSKAPSVDAKSPTYGKPTSDTHLLINEEISHDEPVITKFTRSPVQYKVESKRPMKKDHIRPAGIPSTIHENMANTYNKLDPQLPQPWDIDWRIKHRTEKGDDVLSTSARSVASSCSLASEVLERARSRRDEFWGKPSEQLGR